jgi:TonB family protein
MKRYFILLLSVGVIAALVSAVSAAPLPELGKWWKDSAIANQLHLTETQIHQIEQSFLDHQLELAKVNAELKQLDADLRTLMQKDLLDEFAIRKQSELISTTRLALEKENNSMMLSMRKVLSGEQWKQLEEIRSSKVFLQGKDRFAPKVISMPRPLYTDAARDAKIEGIVRLKAMVRKNGSVDSFRVVQGLGYGLDERAIETIGKYWKFQPGTLKGQPVDAEVTIEISFRLY